MLVSVKQAAEKLGINEMTLRQQIHRGVYFGPFFELVDGKQMAELEDLVSFDYAPKIYKVGVRFSEVEKARLYENASGKPLSVYIRDRVL